MEALRQTQLSLRHRNAARALLVPPLARGQQAAKAVRSAGRGDHRAGSHRAARAAASCCMVLAAGTCRAPST